MGSKRPLFVGETFLPEKRQKIDPEYVQITASTEEVEDRIKTFVATKRELVNQSNRREFRSVDPNIRESMWIQQRQLITQGLVPEKMPGSLTEKIK